jgi:hypothetical protein
MGRRTSSHTLSLPLANACNPDCKRIRPGRRITRATVLPLVFHLAPTHLGWDTQRQFYSSVQGPPGVETPTCLEGESAIVCEHGIAVTGEHIILVHGNGHPKMRVVFWVDHRIKHQVKEPQFLDINITHVMP